MKLLGDGIAALTPARSAPSELALDQEGRFLYVLLPGIGSVGAFVIQADGRLDPIPDSSAGSVQVPTSVVGLAAL